MAGTVGESSETLFAGLSQLCLFTGAMEAQASLSSLMASSLSLDFRHTTPSLFVSTVNLQIGDLPKSPSFFRVSLALVLEAWVDENHGRSAILLRFCFCLSSWAGREKTKY